MNAIVYPGCLSCGGAGLALQCRGLGLVRDIWGMKGGFDRDIYVGLYGKWIQACHTVGFARV